MKTGLSNDNILKGFSNTDDIEKAAKLPEGSKRKFGTNWYIKQGGKWVYVPSKEHKEHSVGKHHPEAIGDARANFSVVSAWRGVGGGHLHTMSDVTTESVKEVFKELPQHTHPKAKYSHSMFVKNGQGRVFSLYTSYGQWRVGTTDRSGPHDTRKDDAKEIERVLMHYSPDPVAEGGLSDPGDAWSKTKASKDLYNMLNNDEFETSSKPTEWYEVDSYVPLVVSNDLSDDVIGMLTNAKVSRNDLRYFANPMKAPNPRHHDMESGEPYIMRDTKNPKRAYLVESGGYKYNRHLTPIEGFEKIDALKKERRTLKKKAAEKKSSEVDFTDEKQYLDRKEWHDKAEREVERQSIKQDTSIPYEKRGKMLDNLDSQDKKKFDTTGLKDKLNTINASFIADEHKPDAKDLKRIEELDDRAKFDDSKTVRFAENMARSIKNKDKAGRRASAAVEVYGDSHPITLAFVARYNELNN